MITRILITMLCLIATSPVFAAHIGAFDTASMYDLHSMAKVTRSTGKWIHTGGDASFSEISDTVMKAGDERIVFNTYAMAESNNATMTMGFGSDVVGNLAGYDLAIFTLDPLTSALDILEPTILDVSIGTKTKKYTSAPIILDRYLEGVFNSDDELIGAHGVIFIDLEYFMPAGAILDEFTINALSADENPKHFSTITAVGAFNTTVVPLPLPIVLFSSGLAFLGFVGRRKR